MPAGCRFASLYLRPVSSSGRPHCGSDGLSNACLRCLPVECPLVDACLSTPLQQRRVVECLLAMLACRMPACRCLLVDACLSTPLQQRRVVECLLAMLAWRMPACRCLLVDPTAAATGCRMPACRMPACRMPACRCLLVECMLVECMLVECLLVDAYLSVPLAESAGRVTISDASASSVLGTNVTLPSVASSTAVGCTATTVPLTEPLSM